MSKMDNRVDVDQKYRRGLWRVPEIPEDSILGTQLSKQPKSLGPMPPSLEEMVTVVVTVLHENSWLANTDRNGVLIAEWIDKNGLAFTLETVRGGGQGAQ